MLNPRLVHAHSSLRLQDKSNDQLGNLELLSDYRMHCAGTHITR